MKKGLVEVSCPSCRHSFLLPEEAVRDVPAGRERWLIVAWCLAGVLALSLVASVLVIVANRKAIGRIRFAYATCKEEKESIEANLTRLEKEAQKKLLDAEKQANAITLDAQKKAEAIREDVKAKGLRVKTEAENLTLLLKREMESICGSLERYKEGPNQIGGKFVQSFEIDHGHIIVNIENTTQEKATPKAEIRFYNQYGWPIERKHIAIFEGSFFHPGIPPGTRRVEDMEIEFWYAPGGSEPYYYVVEEN